MGASTVSRLFPVAYDLSGRWRVIHRVERSSLRRYVGLEIEFDATLRQEGDRITGTAKKFLADLMIVPKAEGSILELSGRASGEHVVIDIEERPAAHPGRIVTGRIEWTVVTDNMLSGTFTVSAANSSGASRALRRR